MSAKGKQISKRELIIARVILIILIILVFGITYLKFFGPNPNLEEHPIDTSNSVQDELQIKLLDLIVTKFNDSVLIEDYRAQNINIEANVNTNNKSIIISYVDDVSKQYEFNYIQPNLEIVVKNEEQEDFYIVYKELIKANQERLQNKNNYDEYIDEFFNGNKDIEGVSKEIKEDDSIKYVMDVTKTIKVLENNNIEGSD